MSDVTADGVDWAALWDLTAHENGSGTLYRPQLALCLDVLDYVSHHQDDCVETLITEAVDQGLLAAIGSEGQRLALAGGRR